MAGFRQLRFEKRAAEQLICPAARGRCVDRVAGQQRLSSKLGAPFAETASPPGTAPRKRRETGLSSRRCVGFAKAQDWVVEQAGLELTASVGLVTPGNLAHIAAAIQAETTEPADSVANSALPCQEVTPVAAR